MRRGTRPLKRKVEQLLKSSDLEALFRFPARQVVNALFSLLQNKDPEIKWASVRAMGAVVARLADDDMEEARVIMRRLMWNLNDESGGIGWGSPEAMGEILACHDGLAEEYTHILISYAREDGNYLEHDMLQRGLLWGIGRLAQVRPHRIRGAVKYLLPYLDSGDAEVRGWAAWIMGRLGVKEACLKLEGLKQDDHVIETFLEGRLTQCRVMDLAEEALANMECDGKASE